MKTEYFLIKFIIEIIISIFIIWLAIELKDKYGFENVTIILITIIYLEVKNVLGKLK